MKRFLIGIGLAAMLMTGCGAGQSAAQTGSGDGQVVINTAQEQAAEADFYAMDTYMNIRAYGDDAQAGVNECVAYINELERTISRTIDSSDISIMNEARDKKTVISEEAADILSDALRLAKVTDGAYDPTVAAYSDLWLIGTDKQRLPKKWEIDTAKKNVGYERVKLDDITVRKKPGIRIDLGGIGKGYAADRCVEILREHGVSQGLISLAGNIYVMGQKAPDTDWTAAIADPDNSEGYLGTLTVSDTSLVTSGDYERYFEENGVRYCHIFDRNTGYPAKTDLRSVTIVSTDSTTADAYSTALFVMGYDKAMAFCEENGVDAVFVCDDHTVHVTEGLKDKFELLNTEYTYAE